MHMLVQDGDRVRSPGHPQIYLIDGGVRRHIPDVMTYKNLFNDGQGIREIDVASIPLGPQIRSGTVLTRAFDRSEVYLIDNHEKRHVASPTTMRKYNFK